MLSKLLPFVLMLWTLIACGAPSTTSTAASAPHTAIIATSTSLPLPTSTSTRRSTGEPELTVSRPTKIPTITPKPITVVTAPQGLIYSNYTGYWVVTATGQLNLLSARRQVLLSHDLQRALANGEILVDTATGNAQPFPYDDMNTLWSPDSRHVYIARWDKDGTTDIWGKDVVAQQQWNLTHPYNRTEDLVLADPIHGDWLLFYSWPSDVIADGVGWIGIPTVMKTDGSDYKVVADDYVSSPAALSPDGRNVAYAIYEHDYPTPWIYRIGDGPQRFPWKNFGLEHFKTMGFASPSWSPDGKKIAWWMWSSDEKYISLFEGIGVFDLEKGRVTLLDNLGQFVPDGWPSRVEWSPDSSKMLFDARHSPPQGQKTNGIWVVDADGSNFRQLIDLNEDWHTCNRAWRPDGQWLAISCKDTNFPSGVWLVEVDTGKLFKTNLPDDAQVRGWDYPQ